MEFSVDIGKTNRRRAFRIYEQVDLFYQKIEHDQENKINFDFNKFVNNDQSHVIKNASFSENTPFEQLLPESQSQVNETLNVNISISGISFTCNEELVPGDYLMIRVLLFSSMSMIMTCCKVVYCKPSNPFEENHFSNFVGVQFVNLRTKDKELLNRHVNKKRTRQLIVTGIFLSLVMTILTMPDLAFDLLLETSIFLFEYFLEIADLLFELIGYGLDHAVEYLFNTDTRMTQITSFYVFIALMVAVLYVLLLFTLSSFKNLLHNFRVYFYRKKRSFFFYWREQTLLYKFGSLSIGIIAILCYGLFFI